MSGFLHFLNSLPPFAALVPESSHDKWNRWKFLVQESGHVQDGINGFLSFQNRVMLNRMEMNALVPEFGHEECGMKIGLVPESR